MARILGIDIGTVRVGLAVSDPDGVLAQPLDVVPRDGATDAIADRTRELEVGEVVVGIPLRMDGSHGPEADAAEDFARTLEELLGLPVARWDERLSTKEAEKAMRSAGAGSRKQRGVVDKVAAAVVLQAFLDNRRQSRLGDHRRTS
jgi:putative Holliday junction resolvase